MTWIAFPIGIAGALLWRLLEKRSTTYQRLAALVPKWVKSVMLLAGVVLCAVLYWGEHKFGWFGYSMFAAGLQVSAMFFGWLYDSADRQRDELKRWLSEQRRELDHCRVSLARKDDEIDLLNARLLEANAELVMLRGDDDLPPRAA